MRWGGWRVMVTRLVWALSTRVIVSETQCVFYNASFRWLNQSTQFWRELWKTLNFLKIRAHLITKLRAYVNESTLAPLRRQATWLTQPRRQIFYTRCRSSFPHLFTLWSTHLSHDFHRISPSPLPYPSRAFVTCREENANHFGGFVFSCASRKSASWVHRENLRLHGLNFASNEPPKLWPRENFCEDFERSKFIPVFLKFSQ